MDGFEFWVIRKGWPVDTASHVFLGNAVHELGKALFGSIWTGAEPATRLMPFSNSQIERSSTFRDEVNKDRAAKRPAMDRFARVKTTIIRLAETEQLATALRPVEGGDPVRIDRSLWNSERLDVRFHSCQMNLRKPFDNAVAGDGYGLIFVTRKSLEECLSAIAAQPVNAAEIKKPESSQVGVGMAPLEVDKGSEFEAPNANFWTLKQVLEFIELLDADSPTARLLEALQLGRLIATGRRPEYEKEIDLDELTFSQREIIPTVVWADLRITPGKTSTVKVIERRGQSWRPAWSDVLIERNQVQSVWSQEAADLDGRASSTRTGLPGRPTSKELYLQKLAVRIESGDVSRSLRQEAEFLIEWLKKDYPGAPSSGLSGVQNAIRDLYNSGKARSPNKKISG